MPRHAAPVSPTPAMKTHVSAAVSTSLRDRLDGPALTEPSMLGRLLRPGTRGSMRGMGEDVRGNWSARSSAAGGLPRCRRKAMDWTFGGLWPYEPRWCDSDDGRMHYVDEGPRDGRPVVLLHGNPTWSFLYRNFIPSLVDAGHRAIAVDHLGFGRSDKPDQAERVKLPLPLRLFRTPGVGEVMVKGLDAFKRGLLFRVGVVKRERITPEVRRAYLAPHPSWSSRTPILVFTRQIPSGPQGEVSDLLAEIEAGLERDFRAKPVAIAWAMKDLAFTEEVLERLWLKTFPGATVTRIEDAGHYLQEDAHERIVPALLEHLGRD